VVNLGYRSNVVVRTDAAQCWSVAFTVLGWALGISAVAAITTAIRRR
jgi:hypothetical protein